MIARGLHEAGWARFAAEDSTLAWCESVWPAAQAAMCDRDFRARWLRAGGTWFVGVNALPNASDGSVGAGPALAGEAVRMARGLVPGAGALALDRAQVSAVSAGFPRREPGESEAALRFRVKRDGAHVDGIKRRQDGARHIGECHAWLLGIGLGDPEPGASPLVVWQGSHAIMHARLRAALEGHDPADWGEIDLTQAYGAARREIFDTCERVELPLARGEASLLHRLTLHGVAPWRARPSAPARVVAYFRPAFRGSIADWFCMP